MTTLPPLELDKANPVLTVILLVGTERGRAPRALKSLLDQSLISRMEIIVLDIDHSGAPPINGADHPQVRYVRENQHDTFGEVRARGFGMASAPIVGFFEEHAVALPGWAEANVQAFSGPWAGIGGETHIANKGIGIAEPYAYLVYYRWLPPARAGVVDLIPGHNSCYRRDVLMKYQDDLPYLLTAETAMQMRMTADGYRFCLAPDAKYTHLMEADWKTASRGLFLGNRTIMATRAQTLRWPLWYKAVRVLATPFLPFYRLTKEIVWITRKRPELAKAYFRHVPVIFVLLVLSVLAQTTGLLFGIGSAGEEFLEYESNSTRLSSHSVNQSITNKA